MSKKKKAEKKQAEVLYKQRKTRQKYGWDHAQWVVRPSKENDSERSKFLGRLKQKPDAETLLQEFERELAAVLPSTDPQIVYRRLMGKQKYYMKVSYADGDAILAKLTQSGMKQYSSLNYGHFK